MAHFAELDENDLVLRVLVVPDNQEHRGQEFCANDLGLGGTWVQTSYNKNFRKNYAGIGYQYDQTRDAFIAPKPYDSWILNEITCRWEAPIDPPILSEEDKKTKMILWDEENLNWKIIQE